MATPEQFDLIVVGSGSGNTIPDYLDDWKIALVERDPVFGGTCLNRGCIPSKMFVLPADLAVDAAESARLGIDVRFHGADWAAIRDRVFARIDGISAGGREYRATGTPNVTLLDRFPPRLGILGGGFVAAEMGHVFAALGSQVTVFNRSDRLLRQHDRD